MKGLLPLLPPLLLSLSTYTYLLSICILFVSVESVVYDEQIKIVPPNSLYPLMTDGDYFGFLSSGVVQVTYHCNKIPKNSTVLVCNKDEASQLAKRAKAGFACPSVAVVQEYISSNGSSAFDPYLTICSFGQILSSYSADGNSFITITTERFLTVLLLSCDPNQHSMITCETKTVLLNPGNEHLSSDEIPLPDIYKGWCVTWGIITLAFVLNFYLYKKFENGLFKSLFVLLVFYFLIIIFREYEYRQMSTNGIESDQNQKSRQALECILQGYILFVLVLISDGWCILRTTMSFGLRMGYSALMIAFIFALMGAKWIHPYFLGLVISFALFIIFLIMRNTSNNLDVVREQYVYVMTYLRRQNLQFIGARTPLEIIEAKFHLLRQFRVCFIALGLSVAIVKTVASFLSEYSWIEALLNDGVDCVIFLTMFFLFRLRNFKDFEVREVIIPLPTDSGIKSMYDSCFAVQTPSGLEGEYLLTLAVPENPSNSINAQKIAATVVNSTATTTATVATSLNATTNEEELSFQPFSDLGEEEEGEVRHIFVDKDNVQDNRHNKRPLKEKIRLLLKWLL